MKIFSWFHHDVDGVCSYLTLKWFYPNQQIEYKTATTRDFEKEFRTWMEKTDTSKYDKIYILDLDVHEYIDLVDLPNVTIIDHHKTHVAEYKRATSLVKEYTSACKLLYKIFSKLKPNTEMTEAQKKLIVIADDFDSYTLALKESKQLDALFWNTQKNVEMFIKWFMTGFHGFNIQQATIINQYQAKIKSIKNNLSIYAKNVVIQGHEYYVCAAFADTAINDVADILKDDYNAEIAFVVNMKTKAVSVRRAVDIENVDMAKLAHVLLDGGGHEYAAGGKVTDKFMQFTKLLKQIK